MSDQRFDKRMKQTLESVRPAYHPRAWNRFQQRLPATGMWGSVATYGGWVLSGLMLTGWLTTLYTLHTNQQVLEKINQRLAGTTPHQIDTVYVVREAVVEHRHLYNPAKGSGRLVSAKQVIANTQPISNQLTDANSQNVAPTTVAMPTTVAVSTEPTAEEQAATEAVPTPTVPEASSVAQTAPFASASATAQAPTQNRKRFRLATLQPRVGIETRAMPNGVGVGPVLELFPIEHLGVSVGLIASQFRGENHRELRDFNSATGREFIDQYRAYLPTQYDQIRDIEVETGLVSLPITVSYYLPLRKRWSLLFQTGTSFDLAAYQQIRYESYFKGDDRFHSFEIDTKPRFFHNFMFGAGIQYRRRRLSAQLSPYYLYDFRGIATGVKGSNAGIRASVWLNLFR